MLQTSTTKTSKPKKDPTLSWEPDVQVNIVKAVRKGLCSALRDLLAHGFVQPHTSTSLVPFLSCATPRPGPSSGDSAVLHPWQLFVAFYRTKDGNAVMSNPQRSLAQSFSLEILSILSTTSSSTDNGIPSKFVSFSSYGTNSIFLNDLFHAGRQICFGRTKATSTFTKTAKRMTLSKPSRKRSKFNLSWAERNGPY